jgi:hypothetical protein
MLSVRHRAGRGAAPEDWRAHARRRLLREYEFVADRRFTAAHPFKAAAIPISFSFPTARSLGLLLGPRVWLALLLALAAALLQLAIR